MFRVRLLGLLVGALCMLGVAQAQAQVQVIAPAPNNVVITGTVQDVGPNTVTIVTPSGAVMTEPLGATTFLSNGMTVTPMNGQVVTCYPYGYTYSAGFLGQPAMYDPYYQWHHRWDWNEYPNSQMTY